MSLEDGYRRLLSLYPRQHRLLYEEEMIAVLMAGAEPGRRRPSPAEWFDLAVSAAAVRFRRAGQALAAEAWRQAAYAVLLGGSIALLVIGLNRLGLATGVRLRFGPDGVQPGVVDYLRPVLWALVVAAALTRFRVLAALLAVAAAVNEGVRTAAFYDWSPSQVLRTCWLLTIAGVVVIAAVALVRAGPVPRPRGLWLLTIGGALAVIGGVADYAWMPLVHRNPAFVEISGKIVLVGSGTACYAIAAVLALCAWLRLPGAVRLRTLVFGVPVLAMLIMVPNGFGGFMTSSQRNVDHPNPLLWFQWVILVAVPVLAFALGVLALQGFERLRLLVRLGRAVEHPEVAPER
jgi:hypothetical protein